MSSAVFCLLLLLLFIGFAFGYIFTILSVFHSLALQQDVEDPRTEALRQYCYGLMLPIICSLGIMGNVLNLIVLTRRNMRGTAYIYMRGKQQPSPPPSPLPLPSPPPYHFFPSTYQDLQNLFLLGVIP